MREFVSGPPRYHLAIKGVREQRVSLLPSLACARVRVRNLYFSLFETVPLHFLLGTHPSPCPPLNYTQHDTPDLQYLRCGIYMDTRHLHFGLCVELPRQSMLYNVGSDNGIT